MLCTLDDGLNASLEHWQQAVLAHRWALPAPTDVKSYQTREAASAVAVVDDSAGDRRSVAISPPHALLAQPLLAVLTNHLLSSLNEIRQCAPYELRPEILSRLAATLRAAVRALAQVHASSPAATENLRLVCTLFSEALLPHMAEAVDLLVPCTAAAEEGGDGGGERMVASVRAQLLPLLPAPAEGVEESAVVAADSRGESAEVLGAREAQAVPAQTASGA